MIEYITEEWLRSIADSVNGQGVATIAIPTGWLKVIGISEFYDAIEFWEKNEWPEEDGPKPEPIKVLLFKAEDMLRKYHLTNILQALS